MARNMERPVGSGMKANYNSFGCPAIEVTVMQAETRTNVKRKEIATSQLEHMIFHIQSQACVCSTGIYRDV